MPPTLKDIANRANVSPALVSMYLNNNPKSRMSAETRQRIDAAIRELNYRPSALARSLRSGKSMTIGYATGNIVGTFSNPDCFFGRDSASIGVIVGGGKCILKSYFTTLMLFGLETEILRHGFQRGQGDVSDDSHSSFASGGGKAGFRLRNRPNSYMAGGTQLAGVGNPQSAAGILIQKKN